MDKEALNRACLEKAIVDHLKDAHEETRDQLREQLDAGDRLNSDLGMAYMTDPKPTYRIVDHVAFAHWVEANMPDALIHTTAVNPAFRDRILKHGGVVLDGETIEVDGVAKVTGSPTLTVKPSDRARESAPLLLHGILEPPTELGELRRELEGES